MKSFLLELQKLNQSLMHGMHTLDVVRSLVGLGVVGRGPEMQRKEEQ